MLVHLAGEPRAQGRQHAAALLEPVRPHLLDLVAREAPSAPATVLLAFVRREAPELVEMLAGLADGLGVSFDALWAYTARGYVDDAREAGCSVAAHTGQSPLLGKNRDFSLAHGPLQAVIAVTPAAGLAWVSLGSLGSPGVYSSGMNSAGLAVADTHVRTWDVGPGLPRFSLMQRVLERYADVPSATEYLLRAPRIGTGTVTLVDTAGRAACVELTHGRAAVRRPDARGWLTATNHFRHPRLRGRNLRPSATVLDLDSSRPRAARLYRAGPADSPEGMLALLAHHARGAASLCRHPSATCPERGTLSSVVYQPAERRVVVGLGAPCAAATQTIHWTGRAWQEE